ncbi:adenylate cyclase type 2-like [Chiloscyllium punctatum]|uniref:adenylate cyclase type 2-like n=2 Tax=Chiloscyllium punctatum TaxID=137246 RepID=UPI003B631C7E
MGIVNLFFLPEPSGPLPCDNVSVSPALGEGDGTVDLQSLIVIPYYIYCCLLGLLSCSLFFCMNFEVKLLLLLLGLVVYNVIFLHTHARASEYYTCYLYPNASLEGGPTPGVLKDPKLMGGVSLFIFFFTLLGLARQNEYSCRLDFLWKRKFRQEREQIETMESLNRVLLENVLPAHVAVKFIGQNRRNEDLYHQSYDCVCVMFASIPDFKEFYSETDVNREGLECLRLLNEIIADFDEVGPELGELGKGSLSLSSLSLSLCVFPLPPTLGSPLRGTAQQESTSTHPRATRPPPFPGIGHLAHPNPCWPIRYHRG